MDREQHQTRGGCSVNDGDQRKQNPDVDDSGMEVETTYHTPSDSMIPGYLPKGHPVRKLAEERATRFDKYHRRHE